MTTFNRTAYGIETKHGKKFFRPAQTFNRTAYGIETHLT